MTYDNDIQRQDKREYAKRDAKDDEIDEMIDSRFYLFFTKPHWLSTCNTCIHEERFVPENDSPHVGGIFWTIWLNF